MATESSSFVQPAIPRFDGHYDHWAMLMENLLRSKEYWSLVETGIPAMPEEGEQNQEQRKLIEEMYVKDLKAKNYLFQAIERSILETILCKDTSKAIWDSMKQKYQGSTKVKRAQLQALRREFELLGMKESETVDEYFQRTLTIANKMKMHGEKMQEIVIVEKILRSMTAKFNYVVCSIEEGNNVATLTIDELQSSLLVHEQRMRGYKEEEQALKVTHPSRGEGRGRGRGRGGPKTGRGRGRQPNKALVECYKCHKLGHYQYECPNWEENANYAENDDEEEMLLMAFEDKRGVSKENVWFLDSGCSNHMCGNKDWFFSLDESFREFVKLGNNSKMTVMGKGNIRLRINGITQTITEVFYIPDLKNNLLSLGQLQQKNLTIVFQNDTCKVYHSDRGLIIETQMSSNRMFAVPAFAISPTSFQATCEDSTYLWHCRYGHLNFKGLKLLSQKQMVRGLPSLKDSTKICTDCLVGKQHREAFPQKSPWRASKRLELIHADICGPIKPESNSNKRYFITFIDDYSRKTWVYFLSEKSAALEIFKKFKAMVEKETEDSICCLRTDRGGEFISLEFDRFCSSNGIKRQLTASYTPQQNGVAERKNRTIMNMVRSMLSEKEVPKQFWPEAVNWSIFVLNRCPTISVKDMTPEEAWSGLKPSVHFFKIFGCVAHVHVPDVQRKKLDSKSIKCVLLGVSDESKAYRLYDPIARKILVSRDVVFSETEKWNWKKGKEEERGEPLEWGDMDQEENTEIAHDQRGENDTENIDSEAHNDDEENEGTTIEPNPNTPSHTPGRTRRKPAWLDDYVTVANMYIDDEPHNFAVLSSNEDPATFEEAVKKSVWRQAMDFEIQAIEKNETWELTTLPAGAKKIGVKWVYKTKYNENGEVDKHKARLVAKGYSQQHGIDYSEVFAPVARWDTIRSILALAAIRGWCIYQLDVKSAFLHGELTETVFVEQPQGYQRQGENDKVYKLKKALYGLKQAPRAWYSKIESYFIKEGFEKCSSEHTLFVKTNSEEKILIVSIYVDDLIFTGNDEQLFEKFKNSMKQQFDMSDLGKMRYFLGIEVLQTEEGIFICQNKYAKEVLERFGMERSKPVHNPMVPGNKLSKEGSGEAVDSTIYKQMVGSLMYLTATRPDLMFAVCLISRYMGRPTQLHLQAAKRILRYLKGTTELGILYRRGTKEELFAFTDSDYAGDVDDRKSTSGYVFKLGTGAISWSSKKQPVVTLSTTEAEFIAASSCACQAIWLRRILDKLGHIQMRCTTIFCDNSSTIKLSRNPVMHGRSKHIDVRFHFLRDLSRNEVIKLVHCNSEDQLSDIMTKPLKLETFLKLRDKLGLCNMLE